MNTTKLRTNPPLLILRDRGNGYILRRKVAGIHWEEAVEQLKTEPALKSLNSALSVDRIVASGIRRASDWLRSVLDKDEESVLDPSNFFVSWNLETNQPVLNVDMSGATPGTLWIA